MAWSLVDHDNWGVTARLNVDFKRPVPLGVPIRAEGWVTDVRRRAHRRPRAGSSTPRRGEVLATARPRSSPRPRSGSASSRSATASGLPTESSRDARPSPSEPRIGPRAPPRSDAVAFVAEHKPRRRGARSRPRRADRRPGARSRQALRAGLAGARRPRVPRGPAARRARDRRPVRRPLAADRGREARLPRGDAPRADVAPGCSSPTGSSAKPELEARWFAFGLLERLVADEPERTWQLLRRAAREAARLDHRRPPRPRRRQGHPRRAVPLGGARAARLLAVALGAPPRRLHDRHDAVRRPTPAASPRSPSTGWASSAS